MAVYRLKIHTGPCAVDAVADQLTGALGIAGNVTYRGTEHVYASVMADDIDAARDHIAWAMGSPAWASAVVSWSYDA